MKGMRRIVCDGVEQIFAWRVASLLADHEAKGRA
jgi:hypothetical protein